MTILKFKRKHNTQQTSPEQEEPSHIPNSTEKIHKSNYSDDPSITNEEIQGTPFRIVHIPPNGTDSQLNGWFITLGMQRIGEIYNTKNEAIQPVLNKDWKLLCNVMVTIIEQVNQIMKQQPTPLEPPITEQQLQKLKNISQQTKTNNHE